MHEVLHFLKALQLVVYRQVPVTDQWLFPIGIGGRVLPYMSHLAI